MVNIFSEEYVKKCIKEEAKREGEKMGYAKGEERGERRGIAQGEERERLRMINNLLKSGVDVGVLSKASGLSTKEIPSLKYLK